MIESGISFSFARNANRSGIENLGNTCYLSAVAQMIIHVRTSTLFRMSGTFGREFNELTHKLEK